MITNKFFFKKNVNYHEMRTQTLHLLECQSPWRNLTVDLPLIRMGLTALQATTSIFKMRLPATHNKPREINGKVI